MCTLEDWNTLPGNRMLFILVEKDWISFVCIDLASSNRHVLIKSGTRFIFFFSCVLLFIFWCFLKVVQTSVVRFRVLFQGVVS